MSGLDAGLLPLVATLLATGAVAGVIAGLLGVGGGIVTVPVLEYMLRFAGIAPEWRMHVAVATSLAAIIPTALSSLRAHHARGAVDWALVRSWCAPMLLAAFAGSLVGGQAKSTVLSAVFGAVALLVALKMLLPLEHLRICARPPRGIGGGAVGAAIGFVSAIMGIGGGTIGVPLMTLMDESIHRAVATASAFGLVIGLPGTLGYLLARPPVAMPALTIGLVSVLGVLLITPGSMLTAPLGAHLAHRLSRRALSAAFGGFLLLVAARMLSRAWLGG